jgi:hypothetical protein
MIKRVAVSTAIIAAIALMAFSPLSLASSPQITDTTIKIKINNNILILSNDIIYIKINLSKGASIYYYSVLNKTMYNCSASNAGLPPGFHIATVRGDLNKPAEASSLLNEPWRAEVVENTSSEALIALTPTSDALKDVSPLNITIFIALEKGQPLPLFIVKISNPSQQPVSLKAFTLNNRELGLEFYFGTCSDEPHRWVFDAAYTSSEGDIHVASILNPNGTSPREFYPVNSTFLGSLFAHLNSNNSVDAVEVLDSSALAYYTAFKNALGSVVLKAYMNISVVEPGATLTTVIRAGVLPSNPALLFATKSAAILPLIDSKGFPGKVREEALHSDIVANLSKQISSLQRELNKTRQNIEQCRSENDNLTRKINELNELLDTCKVNKQILENQTARLRSELDSAGVKIAASSAISLIVGIIGGYLINRKGK